MTCRHRPTGNVHHANVEKPGCLPEEEKIQVPSLRLQKWFAVFFCEHGCPSIWWAQAQEFRETSTRAKGAQRSYQLQNIVLRGNALWVSEDEFQWLKSGTLGKTYPFLSNIHLVH